MAQIAHDQLTEFISDLYSMELQALAQLKDAPKIAGHPSLEADFAKHCEETESQIESVKSRLEARGESPSKTKDAVMKVGGKGFLLFAKLLTETPGRLVAHAYSFEAMEWAGYEVMAGFAAAADDAESEQMARSIQAEERTMMHRLERGFDAAEEASHKDVDPADLASHVKQHLAEAHALDEQGQKLLDKGVSAAKGEGLGSLYAEHRKAVLGQQEAVEERLKALGSERSVLMDASMALGALNWSTFFKSQADTAAKMAVFVYAVYHLQIAGYELLLRVARRAEDAETEGLCKNIIAARREQAEELETRFAEAVGQTLRDQG